MTQYAFYFDGTRCTGCKTCLLACLDKKDLKASMAYRKVYEYAGGETLRDGAGVLSSSCFAYTVSMSCNHCDDAACVENCPTGAMMKNEETGLVYNDPETCIGCGTCVNSCPYGAPKIDDDLGISVKCDGCADLVASGEKPVCVTSCPVRVLGFGTAEEMSAKGERGNIAPLPDPSQTSPNWYVTPSVSAKPFDTAEGEVANLLEVS